MIELIIKATLAAIPMIIGYLMFDKEQSFGYFLMILGFLLIVFVVISDVVHKHKRLKHKSYGMVD